MRKIGSFLQKVKRFLKSAKISLFKKNSTLLKYGLITSAWAITFIISYIFYVLHDLPSVNNLEKDIPRQKVTMLDNKGNVLAVYGDIYGNDVKYYELPRNLVNAVVATEDRKFFEHNGIDFWSIFRASIANFRAGRTVQGGSTITQQLAKIMFLSSERTLGRKIKEALLALQIEHKYSKQQILSLYLNKAYMGSGIFGVSAASKYYFAKNVRNLTLYESAIIAGLLKSPTKFSPTNNSVLSGNRAYQIILNMYDAGFITKKDLKNAENASVILDTKLLGSVRRDYFTNWVYDQTLTYAKDDSTNIVVQTTFDTEIQGIAKRNFNKQLEILRSDYNANQGAVVIMDYKGEIVSMIGGENFYKSSFNRAVQAYRQSGSIFKTFVYTAAMESGYSPEDMVVDKPISYKGYAPRNAKREFLGSITLETSFKKSLNTVPVQLMAKVGTHKVIDVARRLGIKSPIEPNLASALGASSSSLIELTTAYATIANNGTMIEPYAIKWIRDANRDELLYEAPEATKIQAITQSSAEKMQLLLRKSVMDGTAKRALSNIKISGKTGTSQDNRDAWFIGYSNDYIIGVWVGNDDYTPTKDLYGGAIPTIIARDILTQITLSTSRP
jgi:penicillin-binding protein 1A